MNQEIIILIDPPGSDGWSHLVGSSIKDLHDFAEKIGLNKCWFSNKRGKNRPHYDLKGEMIDRTIQNGARQVNSRQIVEFLKQHYSK